MKKKKLYYIGLLFILVGITIFIFYFKTGEVFFKDFDEVTQVEHPKIIDDKDYVIRGRYEDRLLLSSLLSFILGVILLYLNKKK